MQGKTSQTPMLRQYLEIKKEYPGVILFFRLGDFYELFFEDAAIGARELEITLTARHKDSPNPVPMCGVPHHSASAYISKLIKKGYRVAVCEQVKNAENDSKLVRREVVKVITPGTSFDSQIADSNESIFLASVAKSKNTYGASVLDLSTGEFLTTEFAGDNAQKETINFIESYQPKEIIFSQDSKELADLLSKHFQDGATNVKSLSDPSANVVEIYKKNDSQRTTLTEISDWFFKFDECEKLLQKQFNVLSLDGFGLNNKTEAVRAAGACLKYVLETQKSSAPHISEINFVEKQDFLILDSLTLKNLGVFPDYQSGNASLFGIIDKTMTGMGARLLKNWLARPLIKISEIKTRQTAVSELCDTILRENLRKNLREVADLERINGKLSLNSANARDLLVLARTLATVPKIKTLLQPCESLLIDVLNENISELPEVVRLINVSISDESPITIADGGTIRSGFSEELDSLRNIEADSKKMIALFEEQEKKRTGIANLKVKFTSVFGYFIEISKGNIGKVPADYERRQTLTTAERYTTAQLKEWEQSVLGADERIKELEVEVFKRIRESIIVHLKTLQLTARALATLDALQSLAEAAVYRNYCFPELSETDEIKIEAGRHPIVEAFIGEQFIPNDLLLNNSTDRLLIITGPNMGGKSTILRQAALIQILAQIGSFVPASKAALPIVDRIWTRVGASDDIASGRSTFMVEMTETAEILHNATSKSLIILDEIGRGTSTFDGLSIAWAVAEFLHNSPNHSAKTLFATHYHELTELAEMLPGAKNYQITAAESNGEVIFLHKLEKGKASKSYGIAVASLAGLPNSVIHRAADVLKRLETYELAIFKDKTIIETDKRKENLPSSKFALRKNATQQFSLFAVSNENVVNELLEVDFKSISAEECKEKILELQSRII